MFIWGNLQAVGPGHLPPGKGAREDFDGELIDWRCIKYNTKIILFVIKFINSKVSNARNSYCMYLLPEILQLHPARKVAATHIKSARYG